MLHDEGANYADQALPGAHSLAVAPVIISMRMTNHASHSGYDRLADYMPCDLIAPPETWTLSQRVIARLLNGLTRNAGSRWYHRANLIAELTAARSWLRNRGQVYHFLYGENSYNYLGLLKNLGRSRPIVCTYHTPKEKFHQIIRNKKPIERLDAVIVVSSVQREIFSDIVDPGRVHYIPHGVDVDYFHPLDDVTSKNKFRCLFVGSHLRDFEVLESVIKALQGKDIEFCLVTKASEHGRFVGMDNVALLNRVDDNELLSLYQSCDLFVMPVTGCTANNALLEATACGMPVVATDLAGVRDYVSDSAAVLTRQGDVQSMVEGIEYLFGNDEQRRNMSVASRECALGFRWENVARQCVELYKALI